LRLRQPIQGNGSLQDGKMIKAVLQSWHEVSHFNTYMKLGRSDALAVPNSPQNGNAVNAYFNLILQWKAKWNCYAKAKSADFQDSDRGNASGFALNDGGMLYAKSRLSPTIQSYS
jgi:hypothetical protein